MSQSAMQEITCPQCGKKHSFRVWDSINTREYPEMKEKVRNDEAFRYRCPDCGAAAILNYNFLYHQQEDKVLIFVDADGSSYEEMKRSFPKRATPSMAIGSASSFPIMISRKNSSFWTPGWTTGSWKSSRLPFGTMWRSGTRTSISMKSTLPPTKTASTVSSSGREGTWWLPWNSTWPSTTPSKKRPSTVSMPFPRTTSLLTGPGRKTLPPVWDNSHEKRAGRLLFFVSYVMPVFPIGKR